MLTHKLALALSALTLVAAQTSNFTINPAEVPAGTRSSWCLAEINTCGTLCAGNPNSNDCNPTDLSFNCTCQNNSAPGLQFYTQTMPTFICQQAYQDCISNSGGEKIAQDKCKNDIQNNCGTLDPNKAQVGDSSPSTSSSASSATSHASSASAAATESGTESGTAPAATNTKNAAANVAVLGNGAAIVAAGLFAALL